MAVRNRKKTIKDGQVSVKTPEKEKEPYTTGTSDLFMFLGLLALLLFGLHLVRSSMPTPTSSTSSSSSSYKSSFYNCDTIDTTENIVNNGQVHARLRQIAERNPQYQPQLLADHVVQFDHFLTPDECQQIVAVGQQYQFAESLIVSDQGSGNARQPALRTSSTLWCGLDDCERTPVLQTLVQRLQDLLQISAQHFEPLQLLQYEEQQFYGPHSDFASREITRRPGPRVYTLLFYLNDVPAGGETYFPELNLTVTPRAGRAILWSNCQNDNVHQRDPLAFHQAWPVQTGVKYAGNVWIHLRNYREPLAQGCLQQYEERLPQ